MTPSPTLLSNVSEQCIEQAINRSVNTTLALFFHTRHGKLEMLTAHHVHTNTDGRVLVGPGNIMRPEDEARMLGLLQNRHTALDLSVNTPDVLVRDAELLVWWLEPQARPMHLRSHANGYSKIVTVWPSLVAAVTHRTLYLTACAGTGRPSNDTPLHHAPLGNVYANTSVCTGTAALPDGVSMKDKLAWESVIFDTAFTHTNHSQTLVDHKRSNPSHACADADYWRNRKGRNKPFPDRLLCPLGFNLGQWITHLKGQGDLT